jgi:hypothetical protein
LKDVDRFMEYLGEFYDRRGRYDDLFPVDQDNQWVVVDYADHAIRPWCIEELCVCGNKATHKIEETTGPANAHPLTAYVCCDCFFGGCNWYPYKNLD